MLTADAAELRRRPSLARAAECGARTASGRCVGGRWSSFPGAVLRTWLVRLAPAGRSADELAARLRAGDPPVIARIEDQHVVLDPRTILPGEDPGVVRTVGAALDG